MLIRTPVKTAYSVSNYLFKVNGSRFSVFTVFNKTEMSIFTCKSLGKRSRCQRKILYSKFHFSNASPKMKKLYSNNFVFFCRTKCTKMGFPWTQVVNWKYIKRSEVVLGTFWKSYTRSIFVLSPGANGKYHRQKTGYGKLVHLAKTENIKLTEIT